MKTFVVRKVEKKIIEDTKQGSYPGELWSGMDVQKDDKIIIKNRSSALAPDFFELNKYLIKKNVTNY